MLLRSLVRVGTKAQLCRPQVFPRLFCSSAKDGGGKSPGLPTVSPTKQAFSDPSGSSKETPRGNGNGMSANLTSPHANVEMQQFTTHSNNAKIDSQEHTNGVEVAAASAKPGVSLTTWDTEQVVNWAKEQRDIMPEDAEVLRRNRVSGHTLLTLTEEKLIKPPYSLPGGPAASLALAIEALKLSREQDTNPTYKIVTLGKKLRSKLKDPANCLVYKLNPGSPPSIHVGVKRVAAVVDRFVRQTTDSQHKSIFFVIGTPKSGKTIEAMVIIPHLLGNKKHISKIATKTALFPCRKVYIDCSTLVGIVSLKQKIWEFLLLVSKAIRVSPPPGITADNVEMLHVADLFEALTHYTIVTIDEYHMLLAGLSGHDRLNLATKFRNMMLSRDSACHFVVTGGTGAALMSALGDAISNGISLFKGAGVVRTDLDSSANELSDVHAFLTYRELAPSTSPAQEIKNGLGYVNCGALSFISAEIASKVLAPELTGDECIKYIIKDYAGRIFSIYNRDYQAVLRHNTDILSDIWDMIIGIRIQHDEWRHFTDEITLQDKSHIYLWREPLFTAYMIRQTEEMGDGTRKWRKDFKVDFPVFDLVLLARLISIVEKKAVIDAKAFAVWYNTWPKDNKTHDDLINFLSERRAAYWKKQNPNWQTKNPSEPQAQSHYWKNNKSWITQTSIPLELFRLMRNATIPHDESKDGEVIKEGAHKFIAYFGQGDRAKATQFLRKAQTFVK